jgi:hypothetical protein
MSHEGRMRRGKENADKGILEDNADTIYYLEHREKITEEITDEKPKKKTKKRKKK